MTSHQQVIDNWCRDFEAKFGVKYLFQGRDARAVKTLLSTGLTPEQIQQLVVKAWAAPIGPKFWNCNRRTMTVCDFCSAVNKIQVEVQQVQAKPQGAF